jgi:hypothetical protein
MIAAPMVVLAALHMDMRCTRCGLYRHEHVRGMNPPGIRACSKFSERKPERRPTVEEENGEARQRGLGGLRPVYGLLAMALLIVAVIMVGAVT